MKKIIFALVLSAFAASAFAADQGFYVGADVGGASTNTYNLSTKTGTAFSVLVGYQFIKYFAVEVKYNDFSSITPVVKPESVKINGYSAVAVGILPFNDQWALLGKLGYASMKLGDSFDVTKSDVTWGIGGQYSINQSWGVRLNYDQYLVGGSSNSGNLLQTQTATTGVVTVSALYRF